jgi:1-deoxy-D-xylulose-5-phosphate reductoisomerase
MVEYADGSVIAQMGNPDMRTPIAQTLAYPERIDSGATAIDLFKLGQFTFEEPDLRRFPCLQLAYDALAAAGTAPTVLNAANEVAVQAFLDGRIRFTGIARIVGSVLDRLGSELAESVDHIMEADLRARSDAASVMAMTA